MVAHAKDPLGKRPKPLTGRWSADFADPLVQARFAVINGVLDQIWVSHPPQEDVVGKILAYRLSKLGKSQGPMDGLCLAQGSQMGKTATALRVKHQLAIQATAAGHAANEFQVIIVGLDQKTSLKSVYQDILLKMKDPDWDYGTEKQLRERISNFVEDLGVELIIVDECQHLRKGGDDVSDVTDALKRLLDLGRVPLVLIGNEQAELVFNRNQQLRARLGLPMQLPALNMKRDADRILFKNFVASFSEELMRVGAVEERPLLLEAGVLDALVTVSGGFFGRVARLLKNAALHAGPRGARTIEPYDLSQATREYAIPCKWVDEDPFSLVA